MNPLPGLQYPPYIIPVRIDILGIEALGLQFISRAFWGILNYNSISIVFFKIIIIVFYKLPVLQVLIVHSREEESFEPRQAVDNRVGR